MFIFFCEDDLCHLFQIKLCTNNTIFSWIVSLMYFTLRNMWNLHLQEKNIMDTQTRDHGILFQYWDPLPVPINFHDKIKCLMISCLCRLCVCVCVCVCECAWLCVLSMWVCLCHYGYACVRVTCDCFCLGVLICKFPELSTKKKNL